MSRLLIVSNRLPVTLERRKGKLRYRHSIGGLATGLSSFYNLYDSTWIGWCGVPSDSIDKYDKVEIEKRLMKDYRNYPVFLSRNDIRMYYHGFSNKTIWPLFHYFNQYTVYDSNYWLSYKRANRQFCSTVLKVARSDDIIWIHDYHLMLLPMYIREEMPDAQIAFFLHIPFPSFEIFRLLPWRRELLDGILGADLIGFHTYDYVRHFLSSVRRLLGYEYTMNLITTRTRIVRVDAFPMGIDYDRFANCSDDKHVSRQVMKMRRKLGDARVILSVDRLDYTKGILQRLEAFDLFLDSHPEYKGKVRLVMVAVPSRTGVETYMQLKREVDEMVGRINGKHGTFEWVPVWYLYRSLPFHSLAALYCLADVCLVTPLRDGMNLIAKEFVASKTDGRGVLILSEMAGAAKELGEAIIVNPKNKEKVSQALYDALSMPVEEQIRRNSVMQKRLKRYNVINWAKDIVDRLSRTKVLQKRLLSRRLTNTIQEKIVEDYKKGSVRLLLLDYDGTMVPFSPRPQRARPDSETLGILNALVDDKRNRVVIVSGRDRKTLDEWLGHLNADVTAEHGVWIKERGKWRMIEDLRNDWKEEIRPVLESYVDRTPGSFLEEKEYSIVWHYRRAEPELASVRVGELRDDLDPLISNLNIGVLEGSKVLEIKNIVANKGRAALNWVSRRKWDFILSIGDDWTDEDIFAVLPESAYSIKVGLTPSRARFNLGSVYNVRALLRELVR